MDVKSARWGFYFHADGPLGLQVDNRLIKGQAAASAALAATIQWLRDQNIQVILIGPVPTYEYSVQLNLAQEKATGQTHLYSTSDQDWRKHTAFIDVVNAAQRNGATAPFHFIDPIQWLCPWECLVERQGVAVYRDSNHLSVEGAMALEKI